MKTFLRAFSTALTILFPLISAHADAETGVIPFCPSGVLDTAPSASAVLTNPSVPRYGNSRLITWLGTATGRTIPPCAFQNWTGYDGYDTTYPRAVTAYASPDTFIVSEMEATMIFKVDSGGLGGPFDTYMPPCFPAASGVCTPVIAQTVFRYANVAGFFDGKWTTITGANNPGFVFERSGSCPSGTPQINNPSNGVPCSYRLRFLKGNDGKFLLTRPIQVVFLSAVSAGAKPLPPPLTGLGHEGGADVAVPMLILAAPNLTLDIFRDKSSITVGETVSIQVKVYGDFSSSNPIILLESSPLDVENWTTVGQGPVNSLGVAAFPLMPTVSTRYRGRLMINGTASGDPVMTSVTVEPKVEEPEVEISSTQQLIHLIEQIRTLMPKIKAKFKKAAKPAQKALRTELKTHAANLNKFIVEKGAEITLLSTKFNLKKNGQDTKKALNAFAAMKEDGFGDRKKAAQKALKALDKGLARP